MNVPKSILINEILRMIEGFKTLSTDLENLIIKQETEGLSVKDYKRALFLLEQQKIGSNMLIEDINNLIEIIRGESND